MGLTGGVGSGKSTVASMLGDRGATVIDADAISRACTAPGGSAIPAIARAFGWEFVGDDGALHRERMRSRVFSDPQARNQLEAILHPLIAAEMARQANSSRARCVVFDIPLLVESPRWRPQLDRIVVVDCSRETQIRRVQVRSQWDLPTIERVMQNQCSRAQRLAAADAVLFNDGKSLEQLRTLVAELEQRFGL
jgi:dephospho-CoA kinase